MAEARKAAGLTQESAAAQLGIDRSTIAKWETGVALPRLEMAVRVADLYRCNIDDLIGKKAG